jgi:RNA polymerase sigma-70 factor (ECF subfamily)
VIDIGGAYERYASDVLRFCVSRTGNLHDGEDVASVVWEEVLRNAGRYEERGTLKASLFQIARNRCTDFHRRAARRLEGPLPTSLRAARWEADVRRRVDALAFLSRLAPQHRRVLALRFLADWSLADVARSDGRSIGAVKALQHRAMDEARTT